MRLLITSHPGFGHVYPAVSVGKVAQQHGHEVAVATGPAYRQFVTNAGLTFFEAGLDWDQSTVTDVSPWQMIIKFSPPKFVKDLHTIALEWKPDIILREETELSGWVVADALKISSATLGLGGIMPSKAFTGETGKLFNAFRVELGLAEDPEMLGIHRNLYLDQYPPGWVPPPLQPCKNYHSIGAATLSQEPFDFGEEKDPHLYCTLGTVHARQPGFIQVLLDALDAFNTPATITLGPQGDPTAFSPPKNVKITKFIPQDEILPKCTAAICHSGTGTVLGALRYGLPLVLIPIAANQGTTAEFAEKAGVAVQLLGKNPTELSRPGYFADLKSIEANDIIEALEELGRGTEMRTQAVQTGRVLREKWDQAIAIRLLEELSEQ